MMDMHVRKTTGREYYNPALQLRRPTLLTLKLGSQTTSTDHTKVRCISRFRAQSSLGQPNQYIASQYLGIACERYCLQTVTLLSAKDARGRSAADLHTDCIVLKGFQNSQGDGGALNTDFIRTDCCAS
ncbi:uncharacterized protein [Periplaneta americana]|uniref:uncharacterized protein n=1 Tax=Periplaneta americana TaxID=6978 RepID=UPI0037E80F2C